MEGALLTSFPPPEFGTRTLEGGASRVPPGLECGFLPDCSPRLLSSGAPTFPGEQVEGTADAREDTGASLRGSCLARPRRALGEGGQGEIRAVPSALVTRSGRAPRGRAPEEEEGYRRGRRSGDEGERWEEGP